MLSSFLNIKHLIFIHLYATFKIINNEIRIDAAFQIETERADFGFDSAGDLNGIK